MGTRRPHRQSWPGRSEFTGEFRKNTLPAKEKGAPLDASEKLRLIYLTGTEDITAEPTTRSWDGLSEYPDSAVDLEDE